MGIVVDVTFPPLRRRLFTAVGDGEWSLCGERCLIVFECACVYEGRDNDVPVETRGLKRLHACDC